ncbi:unnamed protein product [Effrenium voratum]|nr:unnamed protein product [Effrenium voratum]
MKILCELHLKETVRAVQTLHNENMFAVCQKSGPWRTSGGGEWTTPRSARSAGSKFRPPVDKIDTGIITTGKATRVVEIYNQDETECITIGASGSTRIPEVCEIVSSFTKIPTDKIQLVSKVGCFALKQRLSDEVASKVVAMGVKSFQREAAKYDHTLVVIGAGLGGMQTMIGLKNAGRKDILCVDRLPVFGGRSWLVVSNKYTKLQTESGNYHVDFMLPDAPITTEVEGDAYKTWPTRDQLLKMFRDAARRHDLGSYTKFNTSVEKVRPLPDGNGYSVYTTPTDQTDGEGELIVASAVLAWPGNLCSMREIEWPGEDDFGGYIAYASFSKVDYREAEGKVCVLYGHGAFTIENVRTLCEHKCKKVIVMCRKRNLCGMRVMSWLVGYLEMPVPGQILLEGMQKMYDLVGFDVWTAHCVKTDEKRTYAHVSQKTAFGVTDVYFLAGYYGIMEVLVDEIKRLTDGCAQTKKGKKIKCQVILKAVGVIPDPQIDKILGVKEMVGLWVNGDPLRSVSCNGMFVEAQNFGSFASGPPFAQIARVVRWFVDYPSDFEAIASILPKMKSSPDKPAYVPSAQHMLPTFSSFGLIPMLNAELNVYNALKHIKQQAKHPPRAYIEECKAEWEAYIRQWKKDGMIDGSKPDVPYPYTVELVQSDYPAPAKPESLPWKYIYIYDSQGMELHCIKHQKFPTHLDFLPYHFLLVSAGEKEIAWRDITHGQQVAEHKMHLGPATCLRQNPKNGIMHVGHNRGVVSMWAPNVKEPVVKMGCQNAQVMALAVSDNYMVTAGAESKWKVWDLRTYKALHSFRTHGYTVTSLDVSMTGMVALAKGCRFEAWKDVFTATPHQTPFITELYKGRMLECTRFRPFEDVCCVGHSDGLSSLIVPGAGKANFDSFEANPFQTKNQRREREVQSLLDKLQPDSIMLDPNEIGQLNREVVKAWQETKKKEEEEQAAESTKNKKKMRGKNKVGNRMKRKALKEGAEQRQKAKSRVSGGGEGEGDDSEEEEEVEAEGRAARQEEAAPPGPEPHLGNWRHSFDLAFARNIDQPDDQKVRLQLFYLMFPSEQQQSQLFARGCKEGPGKGTPCHK